MESFELHLENFLAIKEATLKSESPITIILAPNRAGKTQILLLLYAIFWSIWNIQRNNQQNDSKQIQNTLKSKIKRTFLLKKLADLLQWDQENGAFSLKGDGMGMKGTITASTLSIEISEFGFELHQPPLYLQPAGLGDYYKGIYSLNKYYPNWHLISEAITDLLNDLFILEGTEPTKEHKELLELYEELFDAKFYVQKERIYIQERGRRYGIEKGASGLKSLSWLYLALKHNLVGPILFLDEPEVNLHPSYIDRLASFLSQMAKSKRIFIATHSDYLLESFNKTIQKENLRIDIWQGVMHDYKAIYTSAIANSDSLIDTSILNETYLDIVKELFEYDRKIEL